MKMQAIISSVNRYFVGGVITYNTHPKAPSLNWCRMQNKIMNIEIGRRCKTQILQLLKFNRMRINRPDQTILGVYFALLKFLCKTE